MNQGQSIIQTDSDGAFNKLFIVPAFNEEPNIGEVIEDLLSVAKPEQILIVNDGSEDGTFGKIRQYPVKHIDFCINLGVSSVMQAGFRFARKHGHSLVIQFDGDGQHIAEQSSKIIDAVSSGGCDIAIGARVEDREATSSFPRHLGGQVLSKLLKIFTGQTIQDPTSGFRTYSSQAIEKFADHFPDEYPEVESIILAHKFGLKIKEVPVEMRPRMSGRSSISFLGSLYYMLKVLLASAVMMLRKY